MSSEPVIKKIWGKPKTATGNSTPASQHFAAPFPKWLTKWTFAIYFILIVPPITLLLFAYQFTFDNMPFTATQQNSILYLSIAVEPDFINYNKDGDRISITMPSANNKEGKITGIVARIDGHSRPLKIEAVLDRSLMKNVTGNTVLAGQVWLKIKKVRIVERIFSAKNAYRQKK